MHFGVLGNVSLVFIDFEFYFLFKLIFSAQYTCALLSHSVETICFVSPSEVPNLPTEGNYPETK